MCGKKVTTARLRAEALYVVFVILVIIFFVLPPAYRVSTSKRATSLRTVTDELPSKCSVNEVQQNYSLLLVVIVSRPKSVDNRNAIRDTWAKRAKLQDVLLLFSIGTIGLTGELLAKITKEQNEYCDLILLHNVKDTYSNLTLKVLSSFIVANQKYNFSYLLKADDDSYIILEKVVKELLNRKSNQSLYWGYMYIKGKVYKTGRHAETKWFLSNTYLPYAQGSGYVLSRDLIKYITVKPNKLMFYRNEDVSVGTWISPYDMERKNDIRLSHNYKCTKEAIVINPVSSKKMYTMYKDFTKKGTLC